MSLKYHVLYYIVKDIEKQYEKDKKADPPAKTPFIDRWIKWQLVGREEDGYPVYQENFLRQGIKEFPFPESQLFKMLVTNFSHCKVCHISKMKATVQIVQHYRTTARVRRQPSTSTAPSTVREALRTTRTATPAARRAQRRSAPVAREQTTVIRSVVYIFNLNCVSATLL